MSDSGISEERLAQLRERAQARADRECDLGEDLTPAEARRLLSEFRTYQIELEIQNEDLRRTQEALTESRQRYVDLYDLAPVGYATIGHKGLVLEANLTLARMLSVGRSDLLNRPFTAYILPDDQDIFYRHRREANESRQHRSCRLRLYNADSGPFRVELDTHAYDPGDGSGPHLRTAVVDLAEQTLAEKEKLDLERQMQHAQKLESLGLLAGGIAHDFNNILMAILGNLDLALNELSPTSPVCRFLREIEKAAQRAADLSGQMLAYSGRGRFVVEPIDLGKTVREMAQLIKVSISKKVVLREELADRLPAMRGDVNQIRQVLLNLITNASEAIGDRPGTITLATGARRCDRAFLDEACKFVQRSTDEPLPEGTYGYVEVSDTGCGMSTGTARKLFEPFFTTKFTGRGLGLSAVLGIVRAHRGAITIRSEPGQGTTIQALFPVSSPETRDATGPEPEALETGGKDQEQSGAVLVVDDEEMVRDVCESMLQSLGYRVLTATNGQDALNVIEEHGSEITCVLLDLTMPVMDGEEMLAEMRRLGVDLRVFLCSGYDETESTRRFPGSALAGFIQKPFNLDTLRRKLVKTSA